MPQRLTSEVTSIRGNLSITDRTSAKNHDALKAADFDAVLCLDRAEFPFDADPDELPLAVWLRHLPAGFPTEEEFEAAVAALKQLLGTGQRVVVHCHHGQGRSVAVVAAYLAEAEGISPDEALVSVAALRGGLSEVSRTLTARVVGRRR